MRFPRPHITKDSPRLFQNDLMEMLSRTHPGVIVAIYLPVGVGLIWHGVAREYTGLSTALLLMLGGMVAWTLTEYWLHRVIMHWIPRYSWGPRMHFWVHGIHHEYPNDPYRLVMPPAVSVTLFFLFLALWLSVFGRYGWAFHGGFTLGYLIYDMSHYLYHHTKPASRWAKAQQRHHLLHHFNPKYDERHFAITVPLWDRLFGTKGPASPKTL